jgi:hypothetical protein
MLSTCVIRSFVLYLFFCAGFLIGYFRAGPRHVGKPGRLIIWRPLNPIFFTLSRPSTGLAKLFEDVCPKHRIIFEEFFFSRVKL